MKQQEARAVIDALEHGREFVFYNYAADTRETLKRDVAGSCFVLTRQNAYQPDDTEKRTFTRDELLAELESNFSYASFGLPPVPGSPTTKKGIHHR
ncbi:MAG: hypothetical protein GYA24_00950 [Candidatus Lokiarchaeota archaeon]|nr:hypothetical protein [Candidatus Lokiarchaeota archaeon]